MNPAAGVVMIQAELALAEYEAQPGIKLLRAWQAKQPPLSTSEIARQRLVVCLNMDRRNVPAFRFREVRAARPLGPFSRMVSVGPECWQEYKRSRKAVYRWEQRL